MKTVFFVQSLRVTYQQRYSTQMIGCWLLKDVNAQAPEHFLVIPKEHIATANDATDESIMGSLSITAARVAKERGFAEQGYRLVMNCNNDGGQTVSHIHLHCLGGRQMTWPPG
jgi:histidine triad (HIT) family protein